jgi:hypothetical protein
MSSLLKILPDAMRAGANQHPSVSLFAHTWKGLLDSNWSDLLLCVLNRLNALIDTGLVPICRLVFPDFLGAGGFVEAVAEGIAEVSGSGEWAEDEGDVEVVEGAEAGEEAGGEGGGIVPRAPGVGDRAREDRPMIREHQADGMTGLKRQAILIYEAVL